MMAAVFLSYTALIWLIFAKFKLLRLSLPLTLLFASVGPLFAFYLILSMNNYHPSSADARVFQRTVQIVPHITTPGRVEQVLAQPNAPMKKGDVLFTVDPRPFQFDVNRLEAALAAASQSVPQLNAAVSEAAANVGKAQAQLSLATSKLSREEQLSGKGFVAETDLDRARRNAEAAKQTVAQAQAAEQKARLAAESTLDGENTTVAQTRQQLEQAKYNLTEATVRAPCDGYVTNLQLEPGALVSAKVSVMPFVCNRDEHNRGMVVATFVQGPYLSIKPGAYAEVVFPMYPGQVFAGKVSTVIDYAAAGQLMASGVFPDVGTPDSTRFAVKIKLDDSTLRLPAGAQGNAAVYSGKVQIAGIIRMAVMRANSWMNYIFFTG